MTPPTLVLAAHGAGDGSDANRAVLRVARQLARGGNCGRVRAAFHLGTPSFAVVLRELGPGDNVTVLPLMTSDGYFSRTVLPRTLAEHAADLHLNLRWLPPLGTHPAVPRLVALQLTRTAARCRLAPSETTVAIVGHGTPRTRASAASTLELAAFLQPRQPWAAVRPAFLDDLPRLEDVAAAVETPNLLVYPFLIGGGNHTRVDLPARVGAQPALGVRLPAALVGCGRRTVLARPFGHTRAVFNLIRQIASRRTALVDSPAHRAEAQS